MNLFIEMLPFISGAVVSLFMMTQMYRSRRRVIWLGLSFLLGICINQLSGEGFQWAFLDILFVTGSAYFFFMLRRFLAKS